MRNCVVPSSTPPARRASTIPFTGSLSVDGVLARTSSPVDLSIPIRTPMCSSASNTLEPATASIRLRRTARRGARAGESRGGFDILRRIGYGDPAREPHRGPCHATERKGGLHGGLDLHQPP